MKTKNALLMALVAVALCACASKEQHGKKLPPGYKIMCNHQGTKFIPVMPGGIKLYSNDALYGSFDSYEEAIAEAWRMRNHRSSLPDTVVWKECLNPLMDDFAGISDSTIVRDLSEVQDSTQNQTVRSTLFFAQGLAATFPDENISSEEFKALQKRDNRTVRKTRNGDMQKDKITDPLITWISNNIAENIDSGKVPVIKAAGDKSWRIDFEWPDSTEIIWLEIVINDTTIKVSDENYAGSMIKEKLDQCMVPVLKHVKNRHWQVVFEFPWKTIRSIPDTGDIVMWVSQKEVMILDSLRTELEQKKK